MARFAAPKPQAAEETPEVKAAWIKLRSIVREREIPDGGIFLVRGVITSITGNPEQPDQPVWKEVTNPRTKEKSLQPHLRVVTKLTEPGCEAIIFRKDIRISFFDGYMRGQAQRSPFRGGFYHIHRAATGNEPPASLVNGTEDFDADAYVNRPLRVALKYEGKTPSDSQYFGRTANITVFYDHVEPLASSLAEDDDDGYGEPEPAPKPADPALERATERQVKFIHALAREAGMGEGDLGEVCADLFSVNEPGHLNRRDASALVEYLQRQRQEQAAKADDPPFAPAEEPKMRVVDAPIDLAAKPKRGKRAAVAVAEPDDDDQLSLPV